MSDICISEDAFWEEWGVLKRPSEELFQYEDVKDQPLNQVWTIIESGADEDRTWYASPGFHIVNKLGYVMTKKAWENDAHDAIFLDAGDHLFSFCYQSCQ